MVMNQVPEEYREDFVNIRETLNNISKGKFKQQEGDYIMLHTLETKGYIQAKWKLAPYIDNPSKKHKVFDKWILTSKGKYFLGGLNNL